MLENRKLIFGFISGESFVINRKDKLFLSTVEAQEGKAPESAPLVLKVEDQGKPALLRGRQHGQVLYGAEIVEIVSPLTGAMLESLIKNGTLTLAQLEAELAVPGSRQPKALSSKLCALVIGHKKGSPGAVNIKANLSEFDFNNNLAGIIEEQVRQIAVKLVYRKTYTELPGDINALEPDVVISLHCNAFNRQASGTETLYYEKSVKGRQVAATIQRHLVNQLGLQDRGITAKGTEDRGGYLLRYTKAPCVIAEPFFIDNDADLAVARKNLNGLALAYARAIDELPSLL